MGSVDPAGTARPTSISPELVCCKDTPLEPIPDAVASRSSRSSSFSFRICALSRACSCSRAFLASSSSFEALGSIKGVGDLLRSVLVDDCFLEEESFDFLLSSFDDDDDDDASFLSTLAEAVDGGAGDADALRGVIPSWDGAGNSLEEGLGTGAATGVSNWFRSRGLLIDRGVFMDNPGWCCCEMFRGGGPPIVKLPEGVPIELSDFAVPTDPDDGKLLGCPAAFIGSNPAKGSPDCCWNDCCGGGDPKPGCC